MNSCGNSLVYNLCDTLLVKFRLMVASSESMSLSFLMHAEGVRESFIFAAFPLVKLEMVGRVSTTAENFLSPFAPVLVYGRVREQAQDSIHFV